MAGQPTQKEATNFGSQMKNSRTREYMWNGIAYGQNKAETERINANLYPYKPLPEDPYDTTWQIHQQIAEPNSGMVSDRRPLPWTQEEIDYLKRKRDAEEYAGFQSWIATKFPITDPANRDLLKKIVPEYFSVRKQNLAEQIGLSAKYATLRLTGPENEDDLKLIYMVETDRVKLPKGPFHDPMAWMANEYELQGLIGDEWKNKIETKNERRYEAGLFNPFRILTYRNAPFAPNVDNMSDGFGDPRVRALGPQGARQPVSYDYANTYGGADLGFRNRAPALERRYQGRAQAASLPSVGLKFKYDAEVADLNANHILPQF